VDDQREYHEIMRLLRDSRMEHGTCEPRSRKACTACNARDELNARVKAYRGAPVSIQPLKKCLTAEW
jgi:hypothetical protein